MGNRVFECFSDIPSLSNYKMTDESRKVAEDNYKLFLHMFNSYKKKYTIIADSDFEEHRDIFYLAYCKACHSYVEKRENRCPLSTYIDVTFRSVCANAIRHYNTAYMHDWRGVDIVPLDKELGDSSTIGDLIADTCTDIAAQYETSEKLRNILEYVNNQKQTTTTSRYFKCSGWAIFKLWITNDFTSTPQFLKYLRCEGLATDEVKENQIRSILSYHRKRLKEALDRGEI